MPGRTKPHAHKETHRAVEPSGAAPDVSPMGERLRQFSFGLLLLGAGVGPLAPTIEATLSLRLITNLFFILSAAIWLVSQALDGKLRLAAARTGLWLVFLIGALLCATVNAVYKYPASLMLFSWFSAVAAFLVTLNECRSRDRRLMLFLTVAAGAFVASLHGLHQVFVELPEARQAFFQNQASVLKQLNIPPEMAQDFGGRLDKNRVFSTFLIANSFAGFLLLMIPAALGYLADCWQRHGPRQKILTALAVLPLLAAFIATGSKGGAVALGIGMLVFAMWAFRDFIARRRLQFIGVAAAIVIVAAIAQISGLLPKVGEYVGSSSVRYGYWRAAAQIFGQHPFVGVGLDNFADHYAAAKLPSDQEARRAHNDYLQFLAEGGMILLAAYAMFLVMYWRRVAKRRSELLRPTDAVSAPARLFFAGVIPLGTGILALEMLCGGTLRGSDGFWGWYWPVALAFGWMIFMAVCFAGRTDYALGRFSRTTIGIACGLIAFLIHSLGDFDHYVPGILQTAWIFMAILLAARRSEEQPEGQVRERRLNALARPVLVLLPAGIALFLLYGFVTPVIESSLLVESARDFTVERPLDLRQRDLESAAALNPWDAQTRALLSDVFAIRWSGGQARTYSGDSTLSKAIVCAKDAVDLDPARSEYYKRLGRLYEARWRLESHEAEDFRKAFESFTKAEDLFPGNPDSALDHARLLDEAGEYDRALGKYRRAVELSETLQYHTNRKFTADQLNELNLRIRQLAAGTTGVTPPPCSFQSPRLRGVPGR